MNMTNLAVLLRDDITTIVVNFNGSDHPYSYKCDRAIAETLALGDIVAVHASNTHNINGEYNLARVVEVHESPQINVDDKRVYKYVICKLDTQSTLAKQNKDEEIGKRLAQRKATTCRDQALMALGLTPDDAKKLLN